MSPVKKVKLMKPDPLAQGGGGPAPRPPRRALGITADGVADATTAAPAVSIKGGVIVFRAKAGDWAAHVVGHASIEAKLCSSLLVCEEQTGALPTNPDTGCTIRTADNIARNVLPTHLPSLVS